MAKTRKVIDVCDGAFNYECIRDMETYEYKVYYKYFDFDECLRYKAHKKLDLKANDLGEALDFIRNAYLRYCARGTNGVWR